MPLEILSSEGGRNNHYSRWQLPCSLQKRQPISLVAISTSHTTRSHFLKFLDVRERRSQHVVITNNLYKCIGLQDDFLADRRSTTQAADTPMVIAAKPSNNIRVVSPVPSERFARLLGAGLKASSADSSASTCSFVSFCTSGFTLTRVSHAAKRWILAASLGSFSTNC
jgi:hypothetical protein